MGAATLAPGQGGIARVARMSARALIGAGVDLDLASYLDDAPVAIEGVRARVARGSKWRFAVECHRGALRASRHLYDSAGMARAHPRFLGPRRPYATWIHGIDSWEGMRGEYVASVDRAGLVLTPSRYTLERFQGHHGPLPTGRACWLGTEDDAPPASRSSFAGPPVVLIVSRLDALEGRKGHRELVACWPRVVGEVPDARLVIAGGGTGLDEMREVARSSPAADRIDVLGFVSEERMSTLYAGAHVFAMPSRQEGFGLVYGEAMRYGLPVIASVHDAGQEVNVDGETGFNVDLDRADELPSRLIELLRDRDRAQAMGRAGERRWRQEFTYSMFAERFLAHWARFSS